MHGGEDRKFDGATVRGGRREEDRARGARVDSEGQNGLDGPMVVSFERLRDTLVVPVRLVGVEYGYNGLEDLSGVRLASERLRKT